MLESLILSTDSKDNYYHFCGFKSGAWDQGHHFCVCQQFISASLLKILNFQYAQEKLIFEALIPNKVVTIRPAQHPWITCHIKNLIRKRKRNFRKFKRTSNNCFWENYKTFRNQTVSEIRKSKQDYYNKLDMLLSTETTNTKLFWKTAKQVLNLGKSSNNIPTLI